MNQDFIKKYESKYAFLTKVLKNFDDINEIKNYEIDHFFEIYSKHKTELSNYYLNYPQYKSFNKLYSVVKKLTKEKDLVPEIQNAEIINGWYLIESKTFETTKRLGAETWCIVKSQKNWIEYNFEKNHYILINKEDKSQKIGVSFDNKEMVAFDENNVEISARNLQKKVPDFFKKFKIKNLKKEDAPIRYIVELNIFLLLINSFLFYLSNKIEASVITSLVLGVSGAFLVVQGNITRLNKQQTLMSLIIFTLNLIVIFPYIGDQIWITILSVLDIYSILSLTYVYVHLIKENNN